MVLSVIALRGVALRSFPSVVSLTFLSRHYIFVPLLGATSLGPPLRAISLVPYIGTISLVPPLAIMPLLPRTIALGPYTLVAIPLVPRHLGVVTLVPRLVAE